MNSILRRWKSLYFSVISMAALLLISGCALMPKRSPYPDPDRLVSVVKVSPAGEEPVLDTDFLAWRNQSKTLGPIAAHVFRARVLSGGAEPERIQSELVSADFFPTLGVRPALGRYFFLKMQTWRRSCCGYQLQSLATQIRRRPEPDRKNNNARSRAIHRRRRYAGQLPVSKTLRCVDTAGF